jgi:Tfp pilus assembly protein PilV
MSARQRQHGATLLVAMIFLVLMSLFAISAFKSSTTHLRIVDNMQARQEAAAAAQKALEDTLSSSLFSTRPEAAEARPVDLDGDGQTDYTAQLDPPPRCYRTKPIKVTELDPEIEADLLCMKSGTVQLGGIDAPDAAANAGNSLCANSEWNLSARVDDPRTGAQVVVHQGVAVRVLEADAENLCQ